MCGFFEVKGREESSGVGDNPYTDAGEVYGGHATVEQYREAANHEPDVHSQEDGEVFSEREMAQGDEFSGLHDQRNGGWEPREASTFDTSLASRHTYLGGLGEVEDGRSDRFNGAGGAFLRLPMFYLEGIVLFPGQKLPLRVLQQRFKVAVEHALCLENNDAPLTLGVTHVRVSRNGRIHIPNYGTTAEICLASHQSDGSVNVITKGKQRFRILTVWTAADGALFARVQIIEEDAKALMPLSRAAFSPMASVYKRSSGRAKRAPTGLVPEPYWTDGESQVASKEEFVEEREDLEQEIQHLDYSRGDCAAQAHVGQEGSEDGVVDDDRTENQDGDDSDDFVAAVTGEDGPDSSVEEDDNSDTHFERPRIRQRLSDVSSTGQRLEEMEAVGREPTEGRNRRIRESEEVRTHSAECALRDPQSSEERGDTEGALNEEHPAKAVIAVAVRPQSRAYANAHKKWRKDASRWSMRAQLSAWPHWVYRQFDAHDLARRAADMLRQMGDHPRMEDLVSCCTALSYYVGSNMPIQDHTRQELLEIDSTLARLKREIQLLEGMDTLRCNYCLEVIARRSDIFVMSTEGAIGAYVNAHGYVHETLTLSCARSMRISGTPQTDNSWFPGYAWVLAKCQTCHLKSREQHMGWRFTAVDPETQPRSFWGIRRTQLIGDSETQPPEFWD